MVPLRNMNPDLHKCAMIFFTCNYNNSNLIYYAIIKSYRVFRSLLEAKTFSLADGCDSAIFQTLTQLDPKRPLKFKTTHWQLHIIERYDQERTKNLKWLDFYIKAAINPYNHKNIDDITLKRRTSNITDAMTKNTVSTELYNTLNCVKHTEGIENVILKTKKHCNNSRKEKWKVWRPRSLMTLP